MRRRRLWFWGWVVGGWVGVEGDEITPVRLRIWRGRLGSAVGAGDSIVGAWRGVGIGRVGRLVWGLVSCPVVVGDFEQFCVVEDHRPRHIDVVVVVVVFHVVVFHVVVVGNSVVR